MAGSSRWNRIVLDSMTFLLDTNTVIALLDPASRETLLARITSHDPGQVATSAIVSHELYYGAHKSIGRIT
jgi:tRNA(fMet)-specific endonuclease VapC